MFAIYGSTNGGRLVAPELGFDPDQMYMHTETFARSITRAIGDDRLGRFFAMRNHLRLGDYLFVHAGIHPDVGLAVLKRDWGTLPSSPEEEDEDPLWIRGPFLTYEGQHQDGVIVIHGHTPRLEVEFLPNRINVDTRAYNSGRLTTIQLNGQQLRFIQAVSKGAQSRKP